MARLTDKVALRLETILNKDLHPTSRRRVTVAQERGMIFINMQSEDIDASVQHRFMNNADDIRKLGLPYSTKIVTLVPKPESNNQRLCDLMQETA
jgi:hypothetical protein